MLDVLATSAVLFMMLSTLPSTSIVSCWARAMLTLHSVNNGGQLPNLKFFLPFTCLFMQTCPRTVCSYTLSESTNLREIAQHFRHFVSTLSAADIDNHVTVGVLGQRLGDDGFSTSEGSWYSSGAALHTTTQHRSLTDFPSLHK